MEPIKPPEGEFHHFQMIDQEGDIPFSVSVLVHYNDQKAGKKKELSPISPDDVLLLHEGLNRFDGNFIKAFQPNPTK